MCSDLNVFVGWQNGRKNKNLAIEPCTFLSDKSLAQRLDTVIANLTAESLKFGLLNLSKNCAKKLVKGILTDYCAALCLRYVKRTLNMLTQLLCL